jgi:hypothetical protein
MMPGAAIANSELSRIYQYEIWAVLDAMKIIV